jgi:hypothetical protein
MFTRCLLGLASLTLFLACDGDPPVPDSGPRVDAFRPPDAGPPPVDAFVPDAGPPLARALAVEWHQRVESTFTLATPADARLTRLSEDRIVISITTGGAPAIFSPGTADERTVGDEEMNRVVQALAWYDEDGRVTLARAVAVADPILEGFTGIGYGVSALEDGTVFVAGRYEAGALFGGTDPLAVTYATVLEEIAKDVFATSAEAYLARFDAPRTIAWTRRARSLTGLAEHIFQDVSALPDGAALVVGTAETPITFGDGETNMTTFEPSADREGYLARYAPDGSFLWLKRMQGHCEPHRVLALPDGSSIVLLRYFGPTNLGGGEPNETLLSNPPVGTIAWDAVARFDPEGNLVWAHEMGSDATMYPGLRDLVLLDDGSVIVAGTFRGETSWPDDPKVPPARLYGVEGLMTRIGPDGTIAWQERIRPVHTLQVQALTVAGDSIWAAVTVNDRGAQFLLPGDEPWTIAPSGADSRLVMLRYNLDGELQAAHLAGENEIAADDLMTLSSGDLVLAARYGDGTILEPRTESETAIPAALAFRNIMLIRYSVLP